MNLLNKIKLTTLNRILYLLLVLAMFITIVLVPQINNTSLVNSTISSKTFFLMKSMLFLAFFSLIYITSLKRNTFSFRISRIDALLFLLLCYIVINRYVIQQNYGFSIRFIELLLLSLFYFFIRIIPIKATIWFFLAIAISGVIQSVYGNLQLLGYYPSNHLEFKMTGSFFNPGPYTGFLSVVWPICLGMYLFKDKLIEKSSIDQNTKSLLLNHAINYILVYIPLIGMITIFLVIPASQSRASWLAVLGSSLLLLEYKYNVVKHFLKKTNRLKKGIILGLALAILAIGLTSIYYYKKDSANGRLFIWKITSKMIAEHPITGVGFDRFKTHYMNYQATYFKTHGENSYANLADNNQYAFNEFLQFFTENGIVGIFLLSYILYLLITPHVTKPNKEVYSIAMAICFAMGIFSCFSYPMQILPIKLVLIVVLSTIASLSDKPSSFRYLNKRKNIFKPVITIVLIGFVYLLGIKTVSIDRLNNGFKTWKQALITNSCGENEVSLILYAKAYPILNRNGDFLMNYGKILMIAKQNKKAIEILKEAQLYLNTTIIETALGDAYKDLAEYNKAETAYKKAYNMIPSRLYPLYLLAKLYKESADALKATTMANTVLNKEVKISSIAIKQIKTEMKKIISNYNKTSGFK